MKNVKASFANRKLGQTLLLASFGVCLAAGGAEASTVTFDFTSPQADAASYTYNADGGLQLIVTPGLFTLGPVAITPGYQVTQVGDGLGVEGTSTDAEPKIDAKQDANGNALNELAIFSFNRVVQLTSISFGAVDTADTMRFFFDQIVNDNILDENGTSQSIKLPPDNILNLLTTYGLTKVTGDLFGFGALCELVTKNDKTSCADNQEWRIQSLTLNYLKNGEAPPEVVPLPGALPLLLGGIGGLAWLSRNKKKKTHKVV